MALALIANQNCTVNGGAGQLGSPLHIAVVHHKTQIVKALLNRNADPNVTDQAGNSPFHKVVEIYTKDEAVSYDLMRSMIEFGADMNLKNAVGETPLGISIRDKKREAIKGII